MKTISILLVLFSSLALAQTSELASSLEVIRHKYQLPSLSAAILKNGKIEGIASVGVRKIDHEAKVTIEDKFHLGSCTKSMTATLVAIFVEEEKFKWDATLPELFPEIDIHQDYKNVTLAMLLAHRSGMQRGLSINTQDKAVATAHLLKSGPAFTPDSTDEYSNAAYVVAAHLLESLSGKTWEKLMQEKIFQPLGMQGCGFGPVSIEGETIPSQPWGHYNNRGTITPLPTDNSPIWGPAGRVHCPLQDWAKYLQLHLDGFNGKDGLIKATSFKQLHNVFPSSGISYTSGGWFRLEREWAGGSALTHTGTNLTNYANVWLLPAKNTALMMVTNMGGDETFSGEDETLNQTWKATNEAALVLTDLYP